MIAFFGRALAGFLGLPRWAHFAIVGVIGFLIWLQFHDRAKIRAHDNSVTVKAQATASAAADDAAEAVTASRNKTEETNAKARNDAARSDDPLRAGFERLRRENPARQPSR